MRKSIFDNYYFSLYFLFSVNKMLLEYVTASWLCKNVKTRIAHSCSTTLTTVLTRLIAPPFQISLKKVHPMTNILNTFLRVSGCSNTFVEGSSSFFDSKCAVIISKCIHYFALPLDSGFIWQQHLLHCELFVDGFSRNLYFLCGTLSAASVSAASPAGVTKSGVKRYWT